MSGTPATKRVIEVSHEGYLHVRNSLLVIEADGEQKAALPAEDVGYLLVDGAAVTISSGALRACAENGVALIVCDARHLPCAVLTPLHAHSLTSAILRGQAAAPLRSRQVIWRRIVAAKIGNQRRLLEARGCPCPAIGRLARSVENGDPKNVEAQAARLYWPRLFGADFRRDSDAAGVNALLNYGYSVLRAATARAICAVGLHPGLGLHHSNQYNPLCLADDLIEPLRPLVDARVRDIAAVAAEIELDRATKSGLLALLNDPAGSNGQSKPLSIALHEYAASVRDVLLRKRPDIEIPDPWPSAA
jgi:CRISPR-associated protein Cas1